MYLEGWDEGEDQDNPALCGAENQARHLQHVGSIPLCAGMDAASQVCISQSPHFGIVLLSLLQWSAQNGRLPGYLLPWLLHTKNPGLKMNKGCESLCFEG